MRLSSKSSNYIMTEPKKHCFPFVGPGSPFRTFVREACVVHDPGCFQLKLCGQRGYALEMGGAVESSRGGGREGLVLASCKVHAGQTLEMPVKGPE